MGKDTRTTIRASAGYVWSGDLSVIDDWSGRWNGVRYAGFINEDDRSAGRGGVGAVADSKI